MKQWISKALGIGRVLLAWAWEIVRGPVGDAIEQLLPVALGIVSELAVRRDLTGAQKRDVAVQRLGKAAQEVGMQAAGRTLNLVVEMAVAKLRED